MSSAGVLRDIHTSGCEIPLESTVGSTCQVLMTVLAMSGAEVVGAGDRSVGDGGDGGDADGVAGDDGVGDVGC
jgi:hypothetical protein